MLRLLLPVAFALCACAAPQVHGASNTLTGPVTTLTPTFCVGGTGATGDCFTGESTVQLKALAIGECVTVTYSPGQAADHPKVLTDLHAAGAAGNQTDCPPSSAPS
jgi:hypothetical protein